MTRVLATLLVSTWASAVGAACGDTLPEHVCLMEGQLPFDVRERWIETDAYYFADREIIERRRRQKTVMVFDQEGAPVVDMAIARAHAQRLAKRRRCEVLEGPVMSKPTASFTLSCPL
ncbi:MAG: hypothetical protein AAF566_09510 [Pseudomonadota bacterium]